MTETKQHNNVLAVKLPKEAKNVRIAYFYDYATIMWDNEKGGPSFLRRKFSKQIELLGEAHSLKEDDMEKCVEKKYFPHLSEERYFLYNREWDFVATGIKMSYASLLTHLGIKEGENWYILIKK